MDDGRADRPSEDSWQKGHSLPEDGCAEVIKEFWYWNGRNLTFDFYPNPDGEAGTHCWACGWEISAKTKARPEDTHPTQTTPLERTGAALTSPKEKTLSKLTKLKAQQDKLPKVRWGDAKVDNCLQFLYLGSILLPNRRRPNVRHPLEV